MADQNDLYRLANEYLEACVAALNTTPQGAPDRVFVSPGVPSWDCCPQLTVHAGGPSLARTSPFTAALDDGHRIQTSGTVNIVVVTASIIRCVPVALSGGEDTIQFPAPSELDDASLTVLSDCWAIFNWVKRSVKAEALFTWCGEVVIGTPVSFAPQGGCAGWQVPVGVSLDGYDPFAS